MSPPERHPLGCMLARMLRENRLKQRLASGEPCLGAFINFPSPHAVQISGVGPPLADYVTEANQQTMLVVQVETTPAVEALPQILKIANVDVVFIGPSDLSQAMGFPGRPNEPAVQEVIDRCIAQIREAGKP